MRRGARKKAQRSRQWASQAVPTPTDDHAAAAVTAAPRVTFRLSASIDTAAPIWSKKTRAPSSRRIWNFRKALPTVNELLYDRRLWQWPCRCPRCLAHRSHSTLTFRRAWSELKLRIGQNYMYQHWWSHAARTFAQVRRCYQCQLLQNYLRVNSLLNVSWHYYILNVFTALHAMQTRSSDENSVCLSVCPSHAWIVTKR